MTNRQRSVRTVPVLVSVQSQSRRLPFEAEIESIPRTVVARGSDYDNGMRTQMHVHSRSQLVFAVSGTMTVRTSHGLWAVPPHRAVWIPAGVEHAAECHEQLRLRSIFVDPSLKILLDECCMVSVTPLLRELILYATDMPRLYPLGGPEDHTMTVLLEQLERAPLAPLYLPMPHDRRLLKIALAILNRPGDHRSVAEWCKEAGISERTFSRLFPAETGISFRQWQQNARILEALRRLSAGESVSNVAIEVGYDSPSAFIFMFRRITGKTPRQYLEGLTHAPSSFPLQQVSDRTKDH